MVRHPRLTDGEGLPQGCVEVAYCASGNRNKVNVSFRLIVQSLPFHRGSGMCVVFASARMGCVLRLMLCKSQWLQASGKHCIPVDSAFFKSIGQLRHLDVNVRLCADGQVRSWHGYLSHIGCCSGVCPYACSVVSVIPVCGPCCISNDVCVLL